MRLVSRATGWSYPLAEDAITLGRQSDCSVILYDPTVSRQHARIQRDAHGYVIHDLGSRSGTFVNGRRIASPHRLAPGDVIQLAKSELVVEEDQTRRGWLRRRGSCLWVVAALAAVIVIALAAVLIAVMPRRSTPDVTVLTPARGSLARVGDQVYIQAEATHHRGVTRLELWVDEILVGTTQASAPQGDAMLQARQGWTFTVTGTYTIRAVAYTAAGRASESEPIPIEVVPFIVNPPTPTPSPTPVPPTDTPIPIVPTDTPTRVPPTHTPTPPPTVAATPTPTGPVEQVIEFWVEPRAIRMGEKATLNWHIQNVLAAYLDGEPVSGPRGAREVSPTTTTIYTLRVVVAYGEEIRLVTLIVMP
jgi:predicted component of type VI protein secretion system